MTLLSLGWAEEYADSGIGFSCLWPETYIATSAVANLAEGTLLSSSRRPDIMGDAAVEILSRPPSDVNGKCFIDYAVLTEAGVADLSRYGGGDEPILDIFVDKP
jgi:NAD(P)-dependent dehydrogenase (short-subunit alcohol dehydrogenase family)